MTKFFSTFFLALVVLTSLVQAQSSKSIPNGLFIDVNAGIRTAGGKVSPTASDNLGLHLDGGVGYMFNPVFGIKGDLGFDMFSVANSNFPKPDKSLTVRANVQGILSISDLANFGTDNFRLLLHAGPGLASNFNPSFSKKATNNDKGLIKGNDDMYNIVTGLTGQYHLNKKWSLNFDVTAVNFFSQNHYLDRMYAPGKISTYSSTMLNISAGIQLRIDEAVKKIIKKGRKSTTPTTPLIQIPVEPTKPVKPAEPVKPTEPAKKPVEPVKLPDADNDGVADVDDKCPNQSGTDQGCPVVEYKVSNLKFKTESAVLNEVSKKELNNLAKYLNDNPQVKVQISGHADATGTEKLNSKLSLQRAQNTSTFLTKKGVSPDRITVEGLGTTQPIGDNNTPKGRAENRRVEIKLKSY